MKGLRELCYLAGDTAALPTEDDVGDRDIVKDWWDNQKCRVTDIQEAADRLQAYYVERSSTLPSPVDIVGPATTAEEKAWKKQEEEEEGKKEAGRSTPRKKREVRATSAFDMAHVEEEEEEEPGPSDPSTSDPFASRRQKT